jgi:hypothetical protein
MSRNKFWWKITYKLNNPFVDTNNIKREKYNFVLSLEESYGRVWVFSFI